MKKGQSCALNGILAQHAVLFSELHCLFVLLCVIDSMRVKMSNYNDVEISDIHVAKMLASCIFVTLKVQLCFFFCFVLFSAEISCISS